MLTDTERSALQRWFAQPYILEKALELRENAVPEALEAFMQRDVLIPLGKHARLPDYMVTEDGKPLFGTNLNPMIDEDRWRDAVEVGWETLEAEIGISHDEIHREIAIEQNDEFDTFLKSVEARKKAREQ